MDTNVPNIISATYNGVAMTKLIEYGSTDLRVAAFVLVAPATGAHTLALNWTGSGFISCIACDFYGVNQTSVLHDTPVVGQSTASPVTIAVPSTPSGLVVDCVGYSDDTGTFTAHASQTFVKYQGTPGDNGQNNMSVELGTGASVTMSWTISGGTGRWRSIGYCLNPSFRGGGAAISPAMIF
jgi:hypothetical protein